LLHYIPRFEEGPRIAGAQYVDMDDIASSKELFPEINPKDLPHMIPPKVSLYYFICKIERQITCFL
jgi:hypothetical protein